MKVLILGGEGMLGHKVFQLFRQRFDTYTTFRDTDGLWTRHPLYADVDRARTLGDVNALELDSVQQAVEHVQPHAVINCIGIVKQREEAKAAIPSIRVNALFPHQLADLCAAHGVRLIHLSTDCVFSGSRGRYAEDDLPDPVDLYGRTKLLGEPDSPGCLTLRTSIIGWELKHRASLLEWFAAQRGRTIKGYRQAIYTGLSTTVLAGLLGDILMTWPALDGLYHVASSPITKYDLLLRMRDALGWQDITIEPDDQFHCDRSLLGSRFKAATGWQSPDWDEMIAGLAAEWHTYEQWRNQIGE
jgi:dTDP-4-dehydrorhamnose reductase